MPDAHLPAFDIDPDAPAVFDERAGIRYRVWLRRRLTLPLETRPPRVCAFYCYNPSTAGAERNDPSATRMIGVATRLGATDLVVVNAMTAVATDPDELAHLADPVGPLADDAIRLATDLVERTGGWLTAGWGTPKGKTSTRTIATARMEAVRAMPLSWRVLRLTSEFYPEHPLYLPGEPVLWPELPPQGMRIAGLRREVLDLLVKRHDGRRAVRGLYSGDRTAAEWLERRGLLRAVDRVPGFEVTALGTAVHEVIAARGKG